MRLLDEAVFFDEAVLDLFQFVAVDLHEFTATGADNMVMMLVFVFMFVPCRSIAKIDLSAKAGIFDSLRRLLCRVAAPIVLPRKDETTPAR